MKVSSTTPTVDFAALREVESAYDVAFKAKQLARRRAHYAFLFQRYQDMLTLDDEGYEVSITLKSATKEVTLNSTESGDCFDITNMYSQLGKKLGALQDEILDLLADFNKEDTTSTFAGTDKPIMHQVVALCMPQAVAPAEVQPTAPNAAKAA